MNHLRLLAPVVLALVVPAALLHRPDGTVGAASDAGSKFYYAAQQYGSATPPPRAYPAPRIPSPAPANPSPRQPSRPILPTRHLPAAGQEFTLRSAPSIGPALIDQVLSAYGSPMSGDGKALYQLGVKYGIDPAFCLAFFVHESGAGTRGEAVLTHNLGNIRAISGAPSKDGYRYYDTWLEGAEGWYRLISNLYINSWGLATVDKIIPVYAPSADNNDPAAYINDVEQLVSAWRAQA